MRRLAIHAARFVLLSRRFCCWRMASFPPSDVSNDFRKTREQSGNVAVPGLLSSFMLLRPPRKLILHECLHSTPTPLRQLLWIQRTSCLILFQLEHLFQLKSVLTHGADSVGLLGHSHAVIANSAEKRDST